MSSAVTVYFVSCEICFCYHVHAKVSDFITEKNIIKRFYYGKRANLKFCVKLSKPVINISCILWQAYSDEATGHVGCLEWQTSCIMFVSRMSM